MTQNASHPMQGRNTIPTLRGPQLSCERSNVFNQQLGLFYGSEVPAPRKVGPMQNVIRSLCKFTRHDQVLFAGEHSDSRRNPDFLARLSHWQIDIVRIM